MYHSIDICQDLAEKLRSPSNVYDRVEEEIRQGRFFSNQWFDLSLAYGLPGIACFYAAMDHIFPDQHWDDCAHQYLKMAAKRYESEGYGTYSLFFGLGGLCFAAYLCSRRGTRYQKILRKLDLALGQEIERILSLLQNDANAAEYISFHYNLLHGLSGIIAYLSLRKDDGYLQKLARDCTDILSKNLHLKRQIGEKLVPNWYIPKQEHLEYNSDKYPQGGFILTTSYGIAGTLSALSIAAWEGNTSSYLHRLIKEIASWIKQKQIKTSNGPAWPHILSLEEEIEGIKQESDAFQNGWSFGLPSASFSLYLAGRAVQDRSLLQFADENFMSIFSKSEQGIRQDPSFSYGKAGMLATTYRMAKLTNSGILMKQALNLENELKKLYDPSHSFGFQLTINTQGEIMKFNDPGLLDGAIGAAIALLLVDGRLDDFPLDRLFLLK